MTHNPNTCNGCKASLGAATGTCVEKRQVFEIPQPKIEVTEHRVEKKKCPCCGRMNRAEFPEDVKGPVQDGNRLQALITYFSHQHLIPVDRLCQIMEDIFDISISPGTCANVDEKLFENLDSFERGLKTYLLAARVLYRNNLKSGHFGCAKAPGFDCRNWVHISHIDPVTAIKSRGFRVAQMPTSQVVWVYTSMRQA